MVTKGGAACDFARNSRHIDVAEAVLFVADVALFFEDAELGADGGIAGLAGHLCEDLADGGALKLVKNVHNLTFAAREGARLGFLSHVLFFQHLC
jgi:hypothetical protein